MNDGPGGSRNWAALSIAIVSLATILAAATSAGIFAAAAVLFGTAEVSYPGWLRLIVMLLAVFSLAAYAVAMSFGLAAPLLGDHGAQRTGTLGAAALVLLQAYAAVAAVFSDAHLPSVSGNTNDSLGRPLKRAAQRHQHHAGDGDGGAQCQPAGDVFLPRQEYSRQYQCE